MAYKSALQELDELCDKWELKRVQILEMTINEILTMLKTLKEK